MSLQHQIETFNKKTFTENFQYENGQTAYYVLGERISATTFAANSIVFEVKVVGHAAKSLPVIGNTWIIEFNERDAAWINASQSQENRKAKPMRCTTASEWLLRA